MSPTAQAVQSGQVSPYDINAVLGTMVDRGVWPYWDTLYVALNNSNQATLASSYTLFSIPIGGLDQATQVAKTKVQTNMQTSGNSNGFGATRCMIMEAIGFGFPSWLPKAVVDQIINNAYFEFYIAEKIFYEGRLEFWPGGFGLQGVTTQTGEETWTNGWATPQGERVFGTEYGKYIAPLIPFKLNLYFPSTPTITVPGGTGAGAITNPNSSAVCVPILISLLDGLTDRAVQ